MTGAWPLEFKRPLSIQLGDLSLFHGGGRIALVGRGGLERPNSPLLRSRLFPLSSPVTSARVGGFTSVKLERGSNPHLGLRARHVIVTKEFGAIDDTTGETVVGMKGPQLGWEIRDATPSVCIVGANTNSPHLVPPRVSINEPIVRHLHPLGVLLGALPWVQLRKHPKLSSLGNQSARGRLFAHSSIWVSGVIAVRISLAMEVTVFCIYLPPGERVTKRNLEALLAQLPTPYIILGYFNTQPGIKKRSIDSGIEKRCGEGIKNVSRGDVGVASKCIKWREASKMYRRLRSSHYYTNNIPALMSNDSLVSSTVEGVTVLDSMFAAISSTMDCVMIRGRRGTLHFVRFPTSEMGNFLVLAKSKGMATLVTTVFATGGGAFKFEDNFQTVRSDHMLLVLIAVFNAKSSDIQSCNATVIQPV
uniref:(California timema) hypothetical protein n=1 Tax=Timema californicum TaxID=61474 RepID=A0A7R9JCR6_TIMCA|nr:unnamed protein product [Timema californicum]